MSAHELDHLAIAVDSWSAAGEVLHREFGARWASGFIMDVFSPCQLSLADDMRVELLEPGIAEHSFVRRFLDENAGNAAPHHITFKVHDIHGAIEVAREAGIEPILVNLKHPQWQEAFLHPRDTGLGFLAQIVHAPHSVEELSEQNGQFGQVCPWPQAVSEPANFAIIYGQVTNLAKASDVLLSVLGATTFEMPGTKNTKGFRWNEGAELVLSEVSEVSGPSGIQGIGMLPPGHKSLTKHYPEGLVQLLEAGQWQEELGLRIASLSPPVDLAHN